MNAASVEVMVNGATPAEYAAIAQAVARKFAEFYTFLVTVQVSEVEGYWREPHGVVWLDAWDAQGKPLSPLRRRGLFDVAVQALTMHRAGPPKDVDCGLSERRLLEYIWKTSGELERCP